MKNSIPVMRLLRISLEVLIELGTGIHLLKALKQTAKTSYTGKCKGLVCMLFRILQTLLRINTGFIACIAALKDFDAPIADEWAVSAAHVLTRELILNFSN